ncbi:MAG: glycosyltransferase family 9 protein [Ignavibacteriales bacterium]|nr:glycosyltransferase family 9 protein [Ignavibacteriales bacterium]
MKQLRVLISRPDRIGDVVLSTPLPREIKRQFPDSFISVLLRSYTKDVYVNNPNVDEIIIINPENEDSSFWSLVKKIRKYKFNYALMLLPNERINWVLFFAGIKTRIGVGHKLFQYLTFTKYVNRKKYIPLRHEADYCMELARKVGVNPRSLDTEIHLSDIEKAIVKEMKAKLAPNDEFVLGIHSSSGNSAPNWKPEEYLALILKLNDVKNIKLVVTDNNPAEILDNLPGIEYPNKSVQLRRAILNIAALDLLFSSSTGPMHIAAALKVDTLSMFCPLTACSPKLWGPLGNEAEIILPKDGYCQTICPGDPKRCSFTGSGGINYSFIFERIMNKVNSGKQNLLNAN